MISGGVLNGWDGFGWFFVSFDDLGMVLDTF